MENGKAENPYRPPRVREARLARGRKPAGNILILFFVAGSVLVGALLGCLAWLSIVF